MKILKIQYILSLCLLIGFMSCEDNYELTENEVSYSDPTETEASLISGTVRSTNNDIIANAEVLVAHDGKMHKLVADNLGQFSINLPKDNSRVLIQAHANSYISSGISAIELDDSNKTNDIKLMAHAETEYNPNITPISLGGSAVITGQILYADGTEAPNIGVILIDLSDFTFISYDLTDENGQYLIASEPFENYALVAFNDCEGAKVISESISLDDQDLDLGIYNSDYMEFTSFSLSGEVINCITGEALTTGVINVSFDENSDFYTTEIVNGSYSFLIDNCQDLSCFNVNISSPGLIDGELNVECQEITGNDMIADYTLCGEEIVYEGEIRLLVGTDSLILTNAAAELDETTGFWSIAGLSEDLVDGFFIVSKATGVGAFGIQVLQLSENGEPVIQQYDGSGTPYTFEILSLDENIRGKFEGTAFTSDGNTIPLSGTYDI